MQNRKARVKLNQIMIREGQGVDYLTAIREDRQQRDAKQMQPFVYENIIKAILSKSKYACQSRTYLTHLSPNNSHLINDKPRSPKNGANGEKGGRAIGAMKHHLQKQENMKKDLMSQLDVLIRYVIKVRACSFVCQTMQVHKSGLRQYTVSYVDAQGSDSYEMDEPGSKF